MFGEVLQPFILSHPQISQRDVRTSLEKQLDPKGSNCFSRGSIPVFLRKPIATCYSPVGVLAPCSSSESEWNITFFKSRLIFSTIVSSNFSIHLFQSCAKILDGVSAITLKSLIGWHGSLFMVLGIAPPAVFLFHYFRAYK